MYVPSHMVSCAGSDPVWRKKNDAYRPTATSENMTLCPRFHELVLDVPLVLQNEILQMS